MPRQRKTPKVSDIVPAPHDYIYVRRDGEEDRLVTTLLLAGESLAKPWRQTSSDPNTPHAIPQGSGSPAYFEDFDWLRDLVEQAQARLAEDPRRLELLTNLREAYGDGDLLRILFRNLFPGQANQKCVYADGKPVLTEREVELLRAAASDGTHEEIAERLGISPKTVNSHLKHIYKKLGVKRTMQAVARAVSIGYLELDAMQQIEAASRCKPRDFVGFGTLLGNGDNLPFAASLKPLTEFGLLLLTLSHVLRYILGEDASSLCEPRGIVCEVNAQGEIAQAFGSKSLCTPSSLAIAPPAAARQGFTPGNLFVVDYQIPVNGLNLSQIVEFTPKGRFARAFLGGKEIGTRLVNCGCMAFAADGRLLVGSGGLTDAILAFSDGGATVERFANSCTIQLAAVPDGRVFALQVSHIGTLLKVFGSSGDMLQTVGGTLVDAGYGGMVLNSRGNIVVTRIEDQENGHEAIEEYNIAGELLRSVPATEIWNSHLFIDAQDCLYVTPHRTHDIKVFSPEGLPVRRIDLGGKIKPRGITFGQEERMWVCGRLT